MKAIQMSKKVVFRTRIQEGRKNKTKKILHVLKSWMLSLEGRRLSRAWKLFMEAKKQVQFLILKKSTVIFPSFLL
jgi:hypothetical protein